MHWRDKGRLTLAWAFLVTSYCLQTGFQPLTLMLADDGAYSWLCDIPEDGCLAQKEQLGGLLLTCSSAEYMSQFAVGLLSDRWGPRRVISVSLPVLLLAAVTVRVSSQQWQLYHVGMVLLGFVTADLGVCSAVWAKVIPSCSRYWFSMVVSATGLCAGVLPLMMLVKNATGWHLGNLWLLYSAVVQIPIGVATVAAMPSLSELDGTACKSESALSSQSVNSILTVGRRVTHRRVRRKGKSRDFAWSFLKTPRFWTYAAYYALSLVGLNYFMSSYYYNTSQLAAQTYGYVFIAVAVVGPAVGWISQCAPFWLMQCLFSSTMAGALALLLLNLLATDITAGFVSLFSFSVIWPNRFEFVLNQFGYENFGKIVGVMAVISGVAVQFNHLAVLGSDTSVLCVQLALQLIAVSTIPCLEFNRRLLEPVMDDPTPVSLETVGISTSSLLNAYLGPEEQGTPDRSVSSSDWGPMFIQLPVGESASDLSLDNWSNEDTP
ncbi:MAG: hypothetical protein KVP17_000290 [Porospora cf. gigantea B]|uniref:uncharacterized protein n=1 Tax=Porospora cf. gigantea B TaxID=2853592 RepID=UPI003571A5E2|nr:MAG: hypothetical protein KVP17_000290 [Porospora cf. gigantea B]